MIITHQTLTDFFDTGHDNQLKLDAMARFFQDMAVRHSIQAHAGPEQLFAMKKIWLLNRMEIQVIDPPELGDELTLTTWSRGFRKYLGFREYTIETPKGPAIKASSIWIFFDFEKRRVAGIPEQMKQAYESLPQTQFETDLFAFKPGLNIVHEKGIDVSLRHSDFDLNGHVNNTIYLSFLQTLFEQTLKTQGSSIQHLRLIYEKEIPLGARAVRAGWHRTGSGYDFSFVDPGNPSVCYARGHFLL